LDCCAIVATIRIKQVRPPSYFQNAGRDSPDDDEDEISDNKEFFRDLPVTMELLAKKIPALGMLQGESKEVILQIAAAKKLTVQDLYFCIYTHFSSEQEYL